MWQIFIQWKLYAKAYLPDSLKNLQWNTHQKSDDHRGRQCSGSGRFLGICISTIHLWGTDLVMVLARLWNMARRFITENLSRSSIFKMMSNIDVVLFSKLHRQFEKMYNLRNIIFSKSHYSLIHTFGSHSQASAFSPWKLWRVKNIVDLDY